MINDYIQVAGYFILSIIWIYILYNFIVRYKTLTRDNPKLESLVNAFMCFSISLTIDSIYWTIFNFSFYEILLPKNVSIFLGERSYFIKSLLIIAGVYVVIMLSKKKIEDLALEGREKREIERLNLELRKINEEILKFAHVIKGISECVFISDLKGTITFVNDAVMELLEYKNTELAGKSFLFMFADEEEKLKNIMTTAIKEGWEGELKARKSSGQILTVYFSASVIKDENEKPLYITGIFRDITQKKLIEEQMMQTERLASIGQLTNGIAHELNNPLTGIVGFAQLLQSNPNCDEEMKKDIETINREAMRAKEILQNLMLFARKHKTQKLMVSINDILRETMKLLNHEIKKSRVRIIENFEPDLPGVIGDYHQFQMVFLNIATNGIQAMGEKGGTLTINTETWNNLVKISITDTGPGIKPEDLNRLFDPFFTTKEVGQGTGLGLSVSYGTIKQYKGKIYVKSNPGEGATFFVELPVGEEFN